MASAVFNDKFLIHILPEFMEKGDIIMGIYFQFVHFNGVLPCFDYNGNAIKIVQQNHFALII